MINIIVIQKTFKILVLCIHNIPKDTKDNKVKYGNISNLKFMSDMKNFTARKLLLLLKYMGLNLKIQLQCKIITRKKSGS